MIRESNSLFYQAKSLNVSQGKLPNADQSATKKYPPCGTTGFMPTDFRNLIMKSRFFVSSVEILGKYESGVFKRSNSFSKTIAKASLNLQK